MRLHAMDGAIERGYDSPLKIGRIRSRCRREPFGERKISAGLIKMIVSRAHGRRYMTRNVDGNALSGSFARTTCKSTGVATPSVAWYAASASYNAISWASLSSPR